MLVPAILMAQVKHVENKVCKETCKQVMELTDEQHAQLSEMKIEHKVAAIKLEAELEILKLKLHHELAKDAPSSKELDNLLSKIYGTKQKLHKGKIDLKLNMKKILTPEQLKHLKKCSGCKEAHGSMMMGCKCGGCGEMGGHKVKKMIIGGSGGCSMGGCSSMHKGCGCKCCSHMAGGSCCSGGHKGCSSAKSACKDVETHVIKIESEE
jgi:Spy/CpxP family protein refolding chaperone